MISINRHSKYYILLIFGALFSIILRAQMTKDTIALKEVTVSETINIISGSIKTEKIDTIFLNNNKTGSLSEILIYHTPVFIKSYGQGGLSSVSFRGTGATHTQVLWNGINLNSPMLGQVDFSLIPVFFIDKLLINYGAASLIETSGGLGGSINLLNTPNWKNKASLNLMQSFGSFGTYKSFVRFNCGNTKFQSKTKLLKTSSLNNYSYTDVSVNPSNKANQQYADYNSIGVMQDLYYRPDNKDIISIKLWWQNDNRNLPSLMTIKRDSAVEHQENKTIKSLIEFVRYGNYVKLKVYGSFISDNLNYTNKITPVFSINKSNTITSGVSMLLPLNNKLSITYKTNYQYIYVNSNNYLDDKFRKKIDNYASIKGKFNDRANYYFIVRHELINFNTSSGILPMAGFDFSFNKKGSLLLGANISRNYRYPEMNDFYWYPYGNPNLIAEKSYSTELSLSYKPKAPDKLFEGKLTIFKSNIDNWIIWMPDTISRYWKPFNLKNVSSKGLETEIKFSIQQYPTNYYIYFQYNYVKSLNKTTYNIYDLSLGKQLIYTPIHSFNSYIELRYKKLSIVGLFSFTGKRYITADNTQYLPAYSITNVFIKRMFIVKSIETMCEFRVNNLFNKQYQSVAWLPMPGINFQIKATVNISK